jgi:hypothetical protein
LAFNHQPDELEALRRLKCSLLPVAAVAVQTPAVAVAQVAIALPILSLSLPE